MVLMVHFPAGAPISGGRFPGLAFKEPVEIGVVGKTKIKGDFFQGIVRMKEQAAGFQQDPLVNMFDRRLAAVHFHQLA